MAYSFTRVWTNPTDFPTIETSEEQVRFDMQDLFNQLLTMVNALQSGSGLADGAVTRGKLSSEVQTALSQATVYYEYYDKNANDEWVAFNYSYSDWSRYAFSPSVPMVAKIKLDSDTVLCSSCVYFDRTDGNVVIVFPTETGKVVLKHGENSITVTET